VTICATCQTEFTKQRMGQKVCSPICASRLVQDNKKQAKERAKLDRALDKAKREGMKTLADLKAEAQKEVNLYVRLRDQGKPCISCGKPWQDTFQAGHYRSRGAAGHLALDPRNIAGQCTQCNLHRHGNQIGFRAGLVEREGEGFVQALENDNEPIKLEREALRQVKTIYRGLTRELRKAKP
jgi:hypothetical protein